MCPHGFIRTLKDFKKRNYIYNMCMNIVFGYTHPKSFFVIIFVIYFIKNIEKSVRIPCGLFFIYLYLI
jgi:hypothetical protein